MSALALTRVFVLTAAAAAVCACASCAATSATPAALSEGETIVGRAMHGASAVLLTTAPALVTIDLEALTMSRAPVSGERRAATLWGLGEVDGTLYSIAGFIDLVRVGPDGETRPAARFDRAVGNLIDTPAGMAAQLAVDAPGSSLASVAGPSADLVPMTGAVRQALGVSRTEEGLLHLLSCSLPPRVVCWLPGADALLAIEGAQIAAGPRLESVGRIEPAALLASPDVRSIQDAVVGASGTVVALVRTPPGAGAAVLAHFAPDGRLIRRLEPREPLRLLLAERAGAVLAVTRSGRVIEVPL